MNEGMKTADGGAELFKALAKMQAQMQAAKKDSINPHFKSHYADLASVVEALRKPMADNGLGFVQFLSGDGETVQVVTRIFHVSGEILDSRPLKVKLNPNTPQALGSAATYLKRYQLQAMTGQPSEDDDANASTPLNTAPPPPLGTEQVKARSMSIKAAGGITESDMNRAGPPPVLDRPAPITFTWGRQEGKSSHEVGDDDILFYIAQAKKTLADPSKAKHHTKETLILNALNAEMRYRTGSK